MWEFITATPNVPFTAAIVLMLVITLMEAISLGMGFGLMEFVDEGKEETKWVVFR